MVRVYSRTESLSLMQLMHACFTGFQVILGPVLAPPDYIVWYGMFSAMLWILVATTVAVAHRVPRIQPMQIGSS